MTERPDQQDLQANLQADLQANLRADLQASLRADLQASTTRWMWVGIALMAALIAAFPIYRVFEPSSRAEAREEQNVFLAESGGEHYDANCATCHGADGRGGLGPAIGSRTFLELVDNDQITQLIALGVPGTPMVSYSSDFGGPMTSSEISAVTAYLRSLEEDAESNPLWRTPLADTDLTGEDLYLLGCAQCHAADRTGIEDLGPDLSPGAFALEESDEWLADRIRAGRNEMPRFGGVLTDGQINLIVAFLRGEDSAPPTETTVPPTGTTLPPAASTTTTTVPDDGDAALLVLGEEIYLVTAGGNGCAECHAEDGQGTGDGPNIIGASKSNISGALGGGVPDMDDITLSSEELEAVYRYLQTLP